jgi:hypothetical protein
LKESTYSPEECRKEEVVASRIASNIALLSITVVYRFKQKAQGHASSYVALLKRSPTWQEIKNNFLV